MLKAYVFAQSKIADVKDHFRALQEDESGAAMIEYALMVGLVAIVAIAAFTTLGTNLMNRTTDIANKITRIS
ncbi:Flp family type IVb pilin [Phenylobacterium sp.]|jgi:Flp pilus assembly pilin Flp|uniref:Flp family type IVb pilin n=1 Tax=Phenylobacterium sp. TaxID=1871053 RepID=UPI002F943DE3